uniref:Uncharacterized protein n=1 Tax=Junco hyemalis TaxID=40217 RepID=A0A8C5IHD5_JUNHY
MLCTQILFPYCFGEREQKHMGKLFTLQHNKNVLHQLPTKARGTAKGIDPQNDLTCLRIRSKKHKIMITPVSISVRTVELCT